MKRESFKSRPGIYTGKCRMRYRYRQCMAFSVCDRSKRWRYFCTVLPYISGMHGTSGAYDGACCRPSQQKSAVMSYKALEKEGSKWHIHGWIAMLGCYMLMMYYTTVSGWMVCVFL